MKRYHVGGIIISECQVVDALGFHGGRLRYAATSEDYLGIRINIEHPNMPEIGDEDKIPIISAVVFRPGIPGDIYLLPNTPLVVRIISCIRAATYSFKMLWKSYRSYRS